MANMEDGLVRLVDSDPCSITNIAQYIEDYIDLVENIPNDIARHISRLHEFNNRYYQLLAELDRFWDFLATSHSNGRLPNGHYPDTSQTTSSSLLSSSPSSSLSTTTITTTNATAATNSLFSSFSSSSAPAYVHNNNNDNHHQLNGTSIDHPHHQHHHHNNDHDTSRTLSSSTSIANSKLLCSKESSATTSNPFSSTSISGNPCTTSATIIQTSLSSTTKSCTESVTSINSFSSSSPSMSIIQVPGSVTDCSKDQQTTSVTTFDHRKGLKAVYNLRRCLIEIQEISDEKLFIVQSILDLLDGKARQLDFDHRNITIGNLQGNLNSKISGFSPLSPLVIASNDSLNHTDSSGNSNNSEIVGKNSVGNSESIGGEIRSTTTKDSNLNANHSSSISSSVNNGNNSSNKRSSSRRNLSSSKSSDMSNGDIISNNHKRLKRGVKGNNKDTRRNRSNKDLTSSPSALYEDPPIDPDEPTYCSCEQISYGEMICCDNTHCPIEWFHFACVSLTTKPKGKWYCPNCRGDRSNIPRR